MADEKTWWEKLLDALARNVALFLVVVGTGLVLVGANGGFKEWLNIKELYFRVLLATIGVSVGTFGMRLLWTGQGGVDTSAIAKECELKISSPRHGSVVGEKIELEGEFRKKPPRKAVLCVIERTPSGRYWFKEQPVRFAERENEWSATVYIGGQSERRTLYIAILGDSGEILKDYFQDVRKKFGKDLGVRDLTPDTAFCDAIDVEYTASDARSA